MSKTNPFQADWPSASRLCQTLDLLPMADKAPSPLRFQSRPFPRWVAVGFVVVGLASFSGLAYMLSTAIQMVASGHGLETYRTFWLVEFNWIGFLVCCAVLIFALVVAAFLQLREHMQWRSLERKYGGPKQ